MLKPTWPAGLRSKLASTLRLFPHASLRVRLVMLVALCTLPAIVVMVVTAFNRYHTALDTAYGIANVAANTVQVRYRDLESNSRELLTVLAALPAINAPKAQCDQTLKALRVQMPAVVNITVVTLNGEFRCSAIPFASADNARGRGWFQQVLATRQFTAGVISRGLISGRSLLIFTVPRLDRQGELVGTLNVSISPQALAPPSNETTLARYAEITVFARDGTLLMRFPRVAGLNNSDQTRSRLFGALLAAANNSRQLLPGIDGQSRFYVLRHLNTPVSGAPLLIASGVDRAAVRKLAFLPLAADLALVVAVAVFIMLWAWWGTTRLVTRRVQSLLDTLQRIGEGDAGARTGTAPGSDELGQLGQGIDSMAMHLQAQTLAHRSSEQQRELSQQVYQDLIEQADVAICVRHQNGEYILVNDAMCRMLGYTRQELLRMRITDVIEPTEERGHLLKPDASIQFNSWMIHKDGHRIPVDVSSVRLPNGDIQSVQQDLSVREAAERDLADERQFVLQALATLPGVLYVADAAGKFLRWNRGLQEVSGYSNEELRALHVTDLSPPEQRSHHRHTFAEFVRGGGRLEGDRELYTKAGRRIPYYLAARAFRWRGTDCMVGMGVDISARVHAQNELQAQQLLLHEVVNSLPGLFTLCSSEGRFLKWNRRLEELSGYSADEFRNLPPLDLIVPEDRERIARVIAQVFKQGAGSINANFLCRDGRQIPHHFTARRLDWDGKPTLIGVAVDVSEQQRAQELLENYVEEVRQLSHRLVSAQEEERRHMAAELHDELGQGLLAIMLSLKEIGEDLPTARANALEKVGGLAGQLSEEVRKLSLDLRPSMLDDLGLAATVRWFLRERMALASFKIHLDMDDNLPRAGAEAELACFRVLQVTLTNAAKHAGAHNVHVSVRIEAQELKLAVTDDGRGFDVAEAHARTLAGKSFGLLGIEERVHAAGGRIRVQSHPGQGTHIEVALPAAVTSNAADPRQRAVN
ncbi:MAG: PAS domain S-box protein [Gammaproteobacteria bacterium]